MGEDFSEKEFYKGSIMGMLENIDKTDDLAYIYLIVKKIEGECKYERRER